MTRLLCFTERSAYNYSSRVMLPPLQWTFLQIILAGYQTISSMQRLSPLTLRRW